MNQHDMPRAPRFAIQLATGALVHNCSGVRTSKTAALAAAHIAAVLRNSRKLLATPRASWLRQGYSESSTDKMLAEASRLVALYEAATVVRR